MNLLEAKKEDLKNRPWYIKEGASILDLTTARAQALLIVDSPKHGEPIEPAAVLMIWETAQSETAELEAVRSSDNQSIRLGNAMTELLLVDCANGTDLTAELRGVDPCGATVQCGSKVEEKPVWIRWGADTIVTVPNRRVADLDPDGAILSGTHLPLRMLKPVVT